jgi:hypothetical protein
LAFAGSAVSLRRFRDSPFPTTSLIWSLPPEESADMPRADCLRPELGSVCRFLAGRRHGRLVRPAPRDPLSGILAELADPRGRN